MHLNRGFALIVFTACSAVALAQTATQTSALPLPTVTDPHHTEEWAIVAPHLPDPLTASADKLETAGDVLRARRFPEDALTFYKAAVIRGGNSARLLKKQGVLHLEMQHGLIARLCFQQAVRLNKKDAEAWNNMGAADFMLGNSRGSVGEYKKAVKLSSSSAIYHSNLSLAYFEIHDARSARRELAKAFTLDPDVLHHNTTGGYNLQILATTHYAEICYEMARVYASQGDQLAAISWLTQASERGFDVRSALKDDSLLGLYLRDDRVKVVLANADQLHKKDLSGKARPPSLGNSAAQ